MARSQYIYFVRYNACRTLLGAFTVKYEAVTWAKRESKHPLEHLQLSRMADGLHGDKTETVIPWE
jgi:hypothetical protein